MFFKYAISAVAGAVISATGFVAYDNYEKKNDAEEIVRIAPIHVTMDSYRKGPKVSEEELLSLREAMGSKGLPYVLAAYHSKRGLIEIISDKEVYYFDQSNGLLFFGDLVEMESMTNLSKMSLEIANAEKALSRVAGYGYTRAKNKVIPLVESNDSGLEENSFDAESEAMGSSQEKLPSDQEMMHEAKRLVGERKSDALEKVKASGLTSEMEAYREKWRERLQSRMSTAGTNNDMPASHASSDQAVSKKTVDVSQLQSGSSFVIYKGERRTKIGYDHNGNKLTAEQTKSQVAALYKKLAAFGDKFSISYPAEGEEKVGVFVFSDPTCGYCQRLHASIPDLNKQGVTVNILMYPRAFAKGADSTGGRIAAARFEDIWCSADPAESMHLSYKGHKIPDGDCSILEEQGRVNLPVNEHYYMGQLFSLQGTPLSFTSNGDVISGFRNSIDYVSRIK